MWYRGVSGGPSESRARPASGLVLGGGHQIRDDLLLELAERYLHDPVGQGRVPGGGPADAGPVSRGSQGYLGQVIADRGPRRSCRHSTPVGRQGRMRKYAARSRGGQR